MPKPKIDTAHDSDPPKLSRLNRAVGAAAPTAAGLRGGIATKRSGWPEPTACSCPIDEAAFQPSDSPPDAKREPVTARRASLSSHSYTTSQQSLTHRGMRGLRVDFGSRCMFRVGAEAGLATVPAMARPRFSKMIRRFL
jgi:hypothetical protein